MAYKTPNYRKVIKKQEGMGMEFYAPMSMILDVINMATIIYNITQRPPTPTPPGPVPPAPPPTPAPDICDDFCCGSMMYSTRNGSFCRPLGVG